MTGTLPNWLERILGISTGPGEGTSWTLEHAWPWPSWITLLLLASVVALVTAIYMREGRGATGRYRMALAAVRLLLVAIVLLMIAQVSLLLKRTGLPYVAVLIDDSLSMSIADLYDDKMRAALIERMRQTPLGNSDSSRWNLARTFLLENGGGRLARLAENYKLRVYFLTGVRPTQSTTIPEIVAELGTARPSGECTPLGAAVRAVLDEFRGAPPVAILVLSDGINTEGPPLSEAAVSAQRKGVPLYLVGIGSDKPVRNLKLSDLLVDDVAFLNDILSFECTLSGVGFQGSKVPVVLREKDQPEVLAKTELTVGSDGQSQTIRLPYRPTKEGRFQYVVEVQPQPGELQTDDNRLEHTVEVRKEKIRVLLVEAYPSYEYRFLRNMLGRDETIELDTVLQDADLEHADQDTSALRVFPVRRDELFAYDVLILGDVNPALLSPSALQNIADFVDQPGKGGALVLIAGPKYMPLGFRDTLLAKLMPIELASSRYPDADQLHSEGFTVRSTELGLISPPMQLGEDPQQTAAVWENLPPLRWLLETSELKPGVRVLAEHPTRVGPDGRHLPVICMHYVGAGKVLMQLTDETWRWRWRVGDVFLERYWVQMIRFLSRGKLAGGNRSVLLSSDQPDYQRGQSVRLRVQFVDESRAPAADDGVTVVVEHQGYPTQRVQLHRSSGRGVFEGVVSRPAVGSYHAWVALPVMEGGTPSTAFAVKPPAGEFEQIRMDTDALRQAAQQTKGCYYTIEIADRLLGDLPPGRQVPIETLPPIPLWNRWPVSLMFLALLIGEWVLRKRRGMV
jgi:hypothetical protein